MNEEQKSSLIAWLNDAHAMEEGLIGILEKQIEETEGKPEMQGMLRQHLEETLEQLGIEPEAWRELPQDGAELLLEMEQA